MDPNYHEDVYEILDELNAAIEEIVDEHNNPDELEVIIGQVQSKTREFIYDLQQDIEKLELIGVE